MSNVINIVPRPKRAETNGEHISLEPAIVSAEKFSKYVDTFKLNVKKLHGIELTDGNGGISLNVDLTLNGEEYRIECTADGINLFAAHSDGITNALSTLHQIIENDNGSIKVPVCSIFDRPDSPYRALMIHIPSHIRTLEQVEHYVDVCYLNKIKFIHLHVADNAAYCLPSKKFPKLETHGHNFTWEEIEALKKYCADRNVEIIPEIDVPGHAKYLNATYPELFSDTPVEGDPVDTIVCIGKPGVMAKLVALADKMV